MRYCTLNVAAFLEFAVALLADRRLACGSGSLQSCLAHFLLTLHAEWAVVGRDHLQVVRAQAAPRDGKSFLFGDQFTVADAYLFTVTNWSNYMKLDLSAYPNLMAFQGRVAERPNVKPAMAAEGLNK